MALWNKEELMLKLMLSYHMLEVTFLNLIGNQIHLDNFWNNREMKIKRKETNNWLFMEKSHSTRSQIYKYFLDIFLRFRAQAVQTYKLPLHFMEKMILMKPLNSKY